MSPREQSDGVAEKPDEWESANTAKEGKSRRASVLFVLEAEQEGEEQSEYYFEDVGRKNIVNIHVAGWAPVTGKYRTEMRNSKGIETMAPGPSAVRKPFTPEDEDDPERLRWPPESCTLIASPAGVFFVVCQVLWSPKLGVSGSKVWVRSMHDRRMAPQRSREKSFRHRRRAPGVGLGLAAAKAVARSERAKM